MSLHDHGHSHQGHPHREHSERGRRGHPHHGHSHGLDEAGTGRLVASIVLNLVITIAEVLGGIFSGSLALLSDAVHNLSDTLSLGVSLAARRIGRREATASKTFGYKRAEIVGAFINLITLVLVALFLVKESIERFVDPQPIDGRLMLSIALVGLAANGATAILLYRGSRSSLNIRSAFLHIVTDGLSSVGVVVGGLLIIYFDVYVVDPIITLLISVYLLVHSYHMLRQTVNILMEGTPSNVDLEAIVEGVCRIEGVIDMHHLHVWQLDEAHVALEAHVVIPESDLADMETIKGDVKRYLQSKHDISHSTLELEIAPCDPESDPHCYDQSLAASDRNDAAIPGDGRIP